MYVCVCIVLCCAVLCCSVLYCVVLCCAVLCCIMLYFVVLCCVVLCCAVLWCAVLCCAVLCCVVLCLNFKDSFTEGILRLRNWNLFYRRFVPKELGNRHPPLAHSVVVIVMMENSVHAEFIHALDGILMARVDGLVMYQLSISIEWRRLLLLVRVAYIGYFTEWSVTFTCRL